MHCPYCKHPLEALTAGNHETHAWQCTKCLGSFLQFHHLAHLMVDAKLSPGGESQAVTPVGSLPILAANMPVVSSHPAPMPLASSPASQLPVPTRTAKPFWRRFSKEETPNPPEVDWDICTYCGKSCPGPGSNCAHCNVERLKCPQCLRQMIGVKRHNVLIDVCIFCQGIFFEKGRLEILIARMQGLKEQNPVAIQGQSQKSSLLLQIATLLEDTDPGPNTVAADSKVGIMQTLTAAVGDGLGVGRKAVYDLLVFLGDLESGNKRP